MVSCVYVYMCLFHDLCVSVHCGHSNRMPFSENLWWVLCFILKQNAIEMYLHEVSTLHRAHIRLTEEWELYSSKLFFRWTYLRSWVVDSSARPQSHDVAHFCFRSFICFFFSFFHFCVRFVRFYVMGWESKRQKDVLESIEHKACHHRFWFATQRLNLLL